MKMDRSNSIATLSEFSRRFSTAVHTDSVN
jgi:hypothetical protein